MNTRIQNWPAALHAFIESRRSVPFAWGTHDCCQFARRGVESQRGSDPAAALKLGHYKRAPGAAVVLRRLGGIEALPGRCGLEEVRVPMAQRGFVLLAEFEGKPTLGICVGDKAVFAGEHGLIFIAAKNCLRAWRV